MVEEDISAGNLARPTFPDSSMPDLPRPQLQHPHMTPLAPCTTSPWKDGQSRSLAWKLGYRGARDA